MTDFKKLEDKDTHSKLVVLFDKKYAKLLKEQYSDVSYTLQIATDKQEQHILLMHSELHEKITTMHRILEGAMGAIAHAPSSLAAALMLLGGEKIKPAGYSFCPQCLNKTIIVCEEALSIMKDIQAMVKEHVD